MCRGDIRDAAAVRARAARAWPSCTTTSRMVPLAKDKDAFSSVNRGGARQPARGGARGRGSGRSSACRRARSSAPPTEPGRRRDRSRTPRRSTARAKLAAEDALPRATSARGPRRDHHPPAHDHGPRPPRHHADPLRVGAPGAEHPRARPRRQPLPVRPRRRSRRRRASRPRRAPARPRTTSAPRSFGTMRETLEGLVRHAGTGSRVVSVPMAPAVAMMKITSRARPLAARRVPLAHVRPRDVLRPRADQARARVVARATATSRCSATRTTGTCSTGTRSSRAAAPRTIARR